MSENKKIFLMVASGLCFLVFMMWATGPLATEIGRKRGIEKVMLQEQMKKELRCRLEIYNNAGSVTDEQIQDCKDAAGTYVMQTMAGIGEVTIK